jgi:flagellar protein FliO/FliZ
MEGITGISLVSTGIRTIGMLLIVLGLLVLVAYIFKKLAIMKQGRKGDAHIRVMSSLHLGAKERISIIEIEREKIVLGITPGNITFLTKLSGVTVEDRDQSGRRADLELKKD